jgi:hypothetical protein
MPNYCTNELNILGKEESVIRFMEQAKQEHKYLSRTASGEPEEGHAVGLLWNFVSPPEEIQNEKDYFSEARMTGFSKLSENNWYEWNCAHWGTKWDVDTNFTDNLSDNFHSHGDGLASCWLEFDTAWSPPLPVVQAMAEQYPDLIIVMYYYEMGMNFQGKVSYENGILVERFDGECDHEWYLDKTDDCLNEWLDDEICDECKQYIVKEKSNG